MASIARTTAQRTLTGISQPGRLFTTSASQFAGAKGKPAKSAGPKKATQSFSKKQKVAVGGSGGGSSGGSGSKSLNLRWENAQPPPDLKDFIVYSPESTHQENLGKPAVVSSDSLDQIRAYGLPRRLDKELARGQAVTVIRETTLDLAQRLERVRSDKTGESVVLSGERGTGKSALILQTVLNALENGWVVLYAPKASEWVTSTTSYAYSSSTQTFAQSQLSSLLLDRLLKANASTLAPLTTRASVTLADGTEIAAGTSLVELIRQGTGVDSAVNSPSVLEAVVGELATQEEVPFLFAVDEVESFFARSEYLTPHGGPVEAYHLSAPLLALDYLTGKKPTRSTLVLSALSHSTPNRPPPIELLHALNVPGSLPITPYTRLESAHFAHATALAQGKINVPRLSPVEAAGIYHAYVRTGRALVDRGDEGYVAAMAAGAGNALEFVRSVTRSISM